MGQLFRLSSQNRPSSHKNYILHRLSEGLRMMIYRSNRRAVSGFSSGKMMTGQNGGKKVRRDLQGLNLVNGTEFS